MKFFVNHCFTWPDLDLDRDIPDQTIRCELDAPRAYEIPFCPRLGDWLAIGGVAGEVQNAVWDCDDSYGRIELDRIPPSDETGMEWVKHLIGKGWVIKYGDLESLRAELDLKRKRTATQPEVKAIPRQATESGLNFDRIAQIMKDTQRTSEILQKAMGE